MQQSGHDAGSASDTLYSSSANTPTRHDAASASVTLIFGTNFVVCEPSGDIPAAGVFGYFAYDTRQLQRSELHVDGKSPQVIRHDQTAPDRLHSISMLGDPITPSALVVRDLELGERLTETIQVLNISDRPLDAVLDSSFATDFADVFEVKRGDEVRRGFVGSGPSPDGALVLAYSMHDSQREVRISADRPCDVLRDALRFDVNVDTGAAWTATITVEPEHFEHGQRQQPLVLPEAAEEWGASLPSLTSDSHRLNSTWKRSTSDLGALRLWDPADTTYPVLAAGVPWFMALFGRDSLIAGMEAVGCDPTLLLGSLRALARRQGTKTDPRTGEAPGKILHELRNGEAVRGPSGWGDVYYGSVDATALFVVALTRAWRWGARTEDVRGLLDAAEAAVDWIRGPGDIDADGFVEYAGDDPDFGLSNQGWKDSFDGIRHADGSLPEGPIALVEVQGYCDAALRGLADLREAFGTGDPAELRDAAAALRTRIDEAFWMPGQETYAVGLDGEKNQIASVTSNPGHLLWSLSVPEGRARALSTRMMQDDMFSGFGLRTLSSTNPGFNPLSYHCGSVWPHDTALAIAGLYAYGCFEAGEQMAEGLLSAARTFDYRLPELFGGFARELFDEPVPYPTTSSPQAWAAAAPLLILRAAIGLVPDVPNRVISVTPRLPEGFAVELNNVRLGDGCLSLEVKGAAAQVIEAPAGIDVQIS